MPRTHIASRGVRGLPIFVDDVDRAIFLGMVADVVQRLGWKCHAHCLMTNHFHLVVTTPDANLAQGMQWLLGCYAQWFNRRHGTAGHLVERRYRARVIDSDAYRLLVTRYVFRNPLEAGICSAPEDWSWSSYAGTVGLAELSDFVEPDWIVGQFGDGDAAIRRLREFARWRRWGQTPPPFRDVAGVDSSDWGYYGRDMAKCPCCAKDVDASFRFCPWCAEPQRRKLVEFFRPHERDRGHALRVSRYYGDEPQVRFSVWDEYGTAEAAVSLDEPEAERLAGFLLASRPRRRSLLTTALEAARAALPR